MKLQRVSGGWVNSELYEETTGWAWDRLLYIGGLWPVYWVDDTEEVKRRYFFGKRKLLVYLTKRKLLATGVRIVDRQGILG
jgi:hypothetical protein